MTKRVASEGSVRLFYTWISNVNRKLAAESGCIMRDRDLSMTALSSSSGWDPPADAVSIPSRPHEQVRDRTLYRPKPLDIQLFAGTIARIPNWIS
jgi:hypothetical protein